MSDRREPDLVATITRRGEILEALGVPTHKRELVDELDVSRSTVDRAVRELDALGLVARDEGYHLTVAGRLVLEFYRQFLADLEDVAAARELLALLDPDAPIRPAMLRGATVEYAEPPSPAQALDPIVELLGGSDEVRALSMAETRPGLLVERFEQHIEEGASFECVYSAEMAEYLRSDFAEEMATLVATGEFDAYRTGEPVPYGLGLVASDEDRHTFLVVYDHDHTLRGTIRNDTREAYRWGEHVYASYREAADPLELP